MEFEFKQTEKRIGEAKQSLSSFAADTEKRHIEIERRFSHFASLNTVSDLRDQLKRFATVQELSSIEQRVEPLLYEVQRTQLEFRTEHD